MESFLNRANFALNFIVFTNFKRWIFENEGVVLYKNSEVIYINYNLVVLVN